MADCPNLQIVTGGSRSPSSSKSSTLPSSTFTFTSVTSMGQRPSALLRPKISLTWVLRGQQQSESNSTYPIANSNGSKIPLFYFFILRFLNLNSLSLFCRYRRKSTFCNCKLLRIKIILTIILSITLKKETRIFVSIVLCHTNDISYNIVYLYMLIIKLHKFLFMKIRTVIEIFYHATARKGPREEALNASRRSMLLTRKTLNTRRALRSAKRKFYTDSKKSKR